MADPHLHFEILDGGTQGVLHYTIRSGDSTLIFNDTIFNLPVRRPGVKGFFIRMMGTTGGPRVTRIGKMLVVTERDKLATHLDRLAGRPKLRRIIPGHGSVMADAAPETLALIARKWAPRALA